MPYKIRKRKGGFKVCKKNGNKCFSKKPLPKKRALKQLAAIKLNENNAYNSIVKNFIKDYYSN